MGVQRRQPIHDPIDVVLRVERGDPEEPLTAAAEADTGRDDDAGAVEERIESLPGILAGVDKTY